MTERLIELGTWRILCDFESNQEIYARIATGGPEQCTCDGCKWFVDERERFYPDELKNFLSSIGIDYRKEVEIVTYDETGQPPLGGWYNFVGRIEHGTYRVISNCKSRTEVC